MRQSNTSIVHTVSQLKGRRLRMARALTGFSRQELFEKIGIATSTIDTWESGRVELSQKSAERVCSALKKVGVACSVDWLLTGNGVPPRIMDELEKSMASVEDPSVLKYVSFLKSSHGGSKKILNIADENIRRELSFFLGLHPRGIFHMVDCNFMEDRYKVGDCVAGIVEKNIDLLRGKVIIAALTNGKTVLCRLLSCDGDGLYTVSTGSDEGGVQLSIKKAAEVIWHRISKRIN